MTAGDCIRRKGQNGLVDKGKADEAARLFDEFETQLRHQNSPRPEDFAAKKTKDAIDWQKARKKRAALFAAKRQAEAKSVIMGTDDPVGAALSHFEPDVRRNFGNLNVYKVQEATRAQALALMHDAVQAFESKMAGLDVLDPKYKERRRIAGNDLVRELKGGNSGSVEAREMAKGVAAALEHLRQVGNAVGLTIPKRVDYGLPQNHSRGKLNSVKEEEWIKFIKDEMALDKMIDLDTGQPFAGTKLDRVLSDTYKRIVTNGLTDVRPGGGISRNIATKRAQSRFLIFKDADAWIRYHDRFGEGDVFNTILAHINGLSRDIALVRVLGPNPDATVRYMERLVGEAKGLKALGEEGLAGLSKAERITDGRAKIRRLYHAVSGEIDKIDNHFWSFAMETNRTILTGSMLLGAWFSSLSDLAFSGVTANLNGLPASKVWMQHLKLFNPLNKEDRKLAAQLGFINDTGLGVAVAQQRFMGEAYRSGRLQKFTDSLLRLSLLTPWTMSGRQAWGMSQLAFYTNHIGRKFHELPEKIKNSFDSADITESDWDIIRNAPLWKTDNGAEFIHVLNIIGDAKTASIGPLYQRHLDAALKLQNLILKEQDLAIPTVTPSTRVITTGGSAPRGSTQGELMRNTFLFKSFPINLVMTHLRRAVLGNISPGDKIKYLAHLVIATGVIGTFSEQLSQISKGRDPLPMDPNTEEGKKTWMKGLSRGGGLGLFGDFIFSDMTRYGGGVASYLAGPVFGTQVPQGLTLTVGNLKELYEEGEARNPGRELTRFAKTMAPGRSLWYASLAFERIIFDEIQKQLDPNYAQSFRSMERRAQQEFNQSFFSPPGSGFPPRRGPDLERALQ